MCSMTELWGGVVPTSVRDYHILRLCCYSCVVFFFPLLVFRRPLVLPQRRRPPSPLPLIRTTPPPTDHRCPRGHLSTWMSPVYRYLASLLAVSFVSPPPSPSSTVAISPCLSQVTRLAPLARPSQPLIHTPLIYLLSIHLGGQPSKKRLPMGSIHLLQRLSGWGLVCQLE